MAPMHPEELPRSAASVSPYQLFMLALSVCALAFLTAQTFLPLAPPALPILKWADLVVCGLFFIDFGWQLWRAPQKWRYLSTWGWLDLLSSIPSVDALRWGRAARIFRVLRVLRALRSARAIASVVIGRRAESAFLVSTLLCLLLTTVCSIAVLEFEVPAGGNITTPEDAVWWAVTTMTTVGYGDRYPISSEGRVVAMFLMAAGVGLFGTLSGVVASRFLTPATNANGELEEIRRLLVELRARLDSAPRADAAHDTDVNQASPTQPRVSDLLAHRNQDE